LRDFQAEWESPAVGLFHVAAFSTAFLPANSATEPKMISAYKAKATSMDDPENNLLKWINERTQHGVAGRPIPLDILSITSGHDGDNFVATVWYDDHDEK
jgi:hypothetical protein